MIRPDHPLRCSSLLLLRTHMPCLISGRMPTELSRAREMVREARVDAAAVTEQAEVRIAALQGELADAQALLQRTAQEQTEMERGSQSETPQPPEKASQALHDAAATMKQEAAAHHHHAQMMAEAAAAKHQLVEQMAIKVEERRQHLKGAEARVVRAHITDR
jgi:hypothetical protein